MSAFNIVRFRVKPGHEEHFVESHRKPNPGFQGFRGGALVKTGERSYCLVGEWESFERIVAARPLMIAMLDDVRADLEDLGGGLGVTDAISGESVVALTPP